MALVGSRGRATSTMAATTSPITAAAPATSGRSGVLYGLAAYGFWGLLPLYFHALPTVPPAEILAHRIVGSVVVLVAIVLVQGRWAEVVATATDWRRLRALALTTLLIAANWFLFIWAVSEQRVIEASLGYFINPLVNVLLGVVVLGEHLSRPTKIAVGLAAVGVAAQAVMVGSLPWISLVLAATFALYGLVRKTTHTGPVVGLLVETALLAPAAVAYLVWLGRRGELVFGHQTATVDLLLLAAGVITAVPLLCFTTAARRLPLTTMGFLQYLAPSGQFLIAVAVFSEPLTAAHGVAFACIWAALALFTWDRLVRPWRLGTRAG